MKSNQKPEAINLAIKHLNMCSTFNLSHSIVVVAGGCSDGWCWRCVRQWQPKASSPFPFQFSSNVKYMNATCYTCFETYIEHDVANDKKVPLSAITYTPCTSTHTSAHTSELTTGNLFKLPSAEVHRVKSLEYLSVSRMITSICSNVSWTASLYCASHGT